MNKLEEMLWVEKYRPKTVQECILPPSLKNHFQAFVDKQEIPNLILAGGHGRGKTSVAQAMLDEVGMPYIKLNGSLDVGLDTLRTDIAEFASSRTSSGKRKAIIFDEADGLNAQHAQQALRAYMQQFSKVCTFIFTCNERDRLIEPLQSRCSVFDFVFTKADQPELIKELFKRILGILVQEGVQHDKAAVAQFVKKFYPDFRKIIGELHNFSLKGPITSGILALSNTSDLKLLFDYLKEKNWTGIRKWVGENEFDEINMMRKMFDASDPHVTIGGNATLAHVISDYQVRHAHAADKQLNFLGFLVEVMHTVEFK